MKNIFITLVLFVSLGYGANAQLVPIATSVDVNDLTIRKNSNSFTIDLFDDGEKIIQMFGAPSSSEPFPLEMMGKVGTLYEYSNNRFITEDNVLFNFELNSNGFSLGNNNVYIKVGDPKSSISNFLPGIVMNGNDVGIYVNNGTEFVDCIISIHTNGISITKIRYVVLN